MRRSVAILGMAVPVCAGFGAFAGYMRHNVPPDCRDPRTLALVHASLTGHFGLPAGVRVAGIKMLAGGPLAFRFVCQADLAGIAKTVRLRSGVRPGFVHYTSRLRDNRRVQDVTVEVIPRMMWQEVQ